MQFIQATTVKGFFLTLIICFAVARQVFISSHSHLYFFVLLMSESLF